MKPETVAYHPGSEYTLKPQGELETFISSNELVLRSYGHAMKKHQGQFRKNGEPYFTHCLAVARIIFEEWGIKDPTMISAALNHDTIEDVQDCTFETVSQATSEEVAKLVEAVSKLKNKDGTTNNIETLKHLASGFTLNTNIALLKLADRLHNMRTLEHMKPQKQLSTAQQTRDVFVPLAEALGLWRVKKELEDIAFSYLEPEAYEKTKQLVANDGRYQKEYIHSHVSFLESRFPQAQQIRFEPASLFTIYQKMFENGEDYYRISDVTSYRVVFTDDQSRMLALNEIRNWENIDFETINFYVGVNARTNNYKAIQVPVLGERGYHEVALVTKKEEDFNMHGVLSNPDTQLDSPLTLIFTTRGEMVCFLDNQVTASQVAARLGSDVLSRACAVRINYSSESLSLNTVIENAQTVDFIFGSEPIPLVDRLSNGDFPLEIATIREYQRLEKVLKRKEEVGRGRQIIMENYYHKGILSLEELPNIESLLQEFRTYTTAEDILALVGRYGQVFGHLDEWITQQDLSVLTKGYSLVVIHGQDHLGILRKLLAHIPKNIAKLDHENILVDSQRRYIIRVWIEGLDPTEEAHMFSSISNDKDFEKVLTASAKPLTR